MVVFLVCPTKLLQSTFKDGGGPRENQVRSVEAVGKEVQKIQYGGG